MAVRKQRNRIGTVTPSTGSMVPDGGIGVVVVLVKVAGSR